MKMKLKLDKATLLKLLQEHVEKLVLGIFLLLTAVIVLGTFSKREQMDKKPEQLVDAVQRARTNLSKGKPVDLKERDYAGDAEASAKPIEVVPYYCTTLWTPHLAPKLELRGAPDLLTVKGLRGTGDFGSIRMAQNMDQPPQDTPEGAAGGMENIEGKWWITITGAVPYKEQNLIYQKVFLNAINDPNAPTDVPEYVGFEVERIEAPLSGNAKDVEWKKPKQIFYSQKIGEKQVEKWGMAGGSADVVPDTCVHPSLTFPLAPLMDQEWGEQAAHDPEIPYTPGAQYGAAPPPDAPAAEEKPDKKKEKPGDDLKNIFGPSEAPRPGASPVAGPGRGPGPIAPGGIGGPGRIMPPGMGGHGMMGLGGGRNPYAPAAQPLDANLDYCLLRYCDFDVDPGKRYIYRARLYLKNPNYGKKDSHLKSKDLAKKEFLFSEWSDPTDPIAVPLDTRVLVKATKPNADVILVKWKKATGTKVYHEDKADRGSVLNFLKVEAKQAVGPGGIAPLPTDGQRRERDDFVSDVMVLDLSGGDRLPGREKMTVPGEMLVMDANGGISIRKELSDRKDVTLLTGGPTDAGTGAMPGPGGLPPPSYPGGRPGGHGVGPLPGPYGGGMPRMPGMPGQPGRPNPYGGQRNPTREE